MRDDEGSSIELVGAIIFILVLFAMFAHHKGWF